MRAEATPVPIPNTTVKIRAADGTMLETAWESRRLPDILIYAHERARYIAASQHAFGAAQTLKMFVNMNMLLHVMSIQEAFPEC